MKRLLIIAAVLLCCTLAGAQKFSVGAGYCNTAVQEKMADVETTRNFYNGAFVEVGVDMPVNRYFSILTKAQAGFSLPRNKAYAKIPVAGKLIFVSDTDFKLFLFLGPEFCYRFSDNGSDNLKVAFEDIRMKQYNVYAAGGVGLDLYDRLRIHLGYEHGFINEFKGEYASYLAAHPTDFVVGVSLLL